MGDVLREDDESVAMAMMKHDKTSVGKALVYMAEYHKTGQAPLLSDQVPEAFKKADELIQHLQGHAMMMSVLYEGFAIKCAAATEGLSDHPVISALNFSLIFGAPEIAE